MRISCLRSPWNDWVFGASSLTSYWHGDCGTKQLAFNASITDFVYRVYPIANIDSGRVPIVVVDVTGRPRIEERYLNGQAVWVRVNVKTDIFSKYPDEIDKIVTGIDRGVFRDRDNFAGASYSTPGALSDLTYVRPDLFNRSVSFQLYKMISKE